ncbi:MAG: T9SS type A sorting domain-containing protein [Saprospiraceae bacterium]|nr:T9SS type A sorting domain-containing protein [Saprospiraceae bacterium]
MIKSLRIFLQMAMLVWTGSAAQAQSGPIIDNFHVSKSGQGVLISWRMLAGNTCNGITIFRATDTMLFNQIGLIPGICGSTTESIRYNHVDMSPVINSTNFYRIEFGGVGISEILSIDIIDLGTVGTQVWPNPVKDGATIFFKNDEGFEYEMKMYSINGIEVYQAKTNQDFFLFISSTLPGGVYTYTISVPGKTPSITGKLVVQP